MPSHYQSTVSKEVAKDRDMEIFLAHLPRDAPVYFYNEEWELDNLSLANSRSDAVVVFKNVPPKVLDEYDERLPGGRIDYSLPLRTLILKMTSHPHEEAASSLECILIHMAMEMTVYHRISKCGARDVESSGRTKQADRSWKPVHHISKWPTVAVEVSYAQPKGRLHDDIAWWINESGGVVKQGITIDIQPSGNIEMLSWVPDINAACGRELRSGSIHHLPTPRINHRIMMKRGGNGGEPTINGDLVIPFASILLEEPGERQSDFVFTHDALLHDIADLVWCAMDKEKELAGIN